MRSPRPTRSRISGSSLMWSAGIRMFTGLPLVESPPRPLIKHLSACTQAAAKGDGKLGSRIRRRIGYRSVVLQLASEARATGRHAVADQLTARAAELLDKIVSDEPVKSSDQSDE